MKKLFTFLLLFAAIFSLKPAMAQSDTTAHNLTEVVKMLNGTWEWTETSFISRGAKPNVKTPASVGYKITVTFKPDNQALVFRNGKLVGTYAYTVSKPTDYLVISFSDASGNNPAREFLEEGPLTVSANQLYIAGGYNDAGSNQTFKKLAPAKTKKATKKKRR
jgi:hypothetical protein